MARRRGGAASATLLMTAVSAAMVGTPVAAETVRPSLNLYGVTGLIDMPSAQSQPDAQVSLSYSYFGETQRRNFTFQILPRVSGTIRYSTIENWGQRDEDTGVYNPRYDLFDRSFDLQFTLLKEGEWRPWTPAVALGFRDFLGTGVYSSEYLVATKTIQSFTITAGLGWGRLSQTNDFENPFCAISSAACDRDNDFGEGGKISTSTFFRGQNVGVFGGVEWQSPIDGLSFKAEYSTDDYKREQESPTSTFKPESQFNFGAEYRVREGITIGGYYMYGSELGVNVAISANPLRPLIPPDFGTGPLPVNARPANAPMGTGWATNQASRDQLAVALEEVLRAEGMQLDSFSADPDGRAVDLAITNLRFQSDPKALGRTTRVLAAGLPASVETFRITMVQNDVRTSTIIIDRSDFEAEIDRPDAGAAQLGQRRDRRGDAVRAGGQLGARRLSGLRVEHRAGAVPDAADAGRSDPDRAQPRRRGDDQHPARAVGDGGGEPAAAEHPQRSRAVGVEPAAGAQRRAALLRRLRRRSCRS